MANPDVIVIGAGAAGIMASWRAASLGAKVWLIEKTPRIGTKILISGGGKCNVAHAGPLEDVIKAFRPNEARFIRPACYRFPNERIVEMLTSRGLEVYTRPDGRVFPVHQTAKDVVAILRTYLDEAKVQVHTETPVAEILHERGSITGIRTGEAYEAHQGFRKPIESHPGYGAKALLRDVMTVSESHARSVTNKTIICPRVILCTGGSSYPNSGTTGDGWPWVRALGHTVEWVHAALAPIYLPLNSNQSADRAGIALRDVVLKARSGGKEIARWRGDLLFTHQGVSGPTALGISRILAEKLPVQSVQLEVDLRPGVHPDEVGPGMLELGTQNPKKRVASYLDELLPERLVAPFLAEVGIPAEQIWASLDRKARNRLAASLKAWSLGDVRTIPLEKGEVVAGGVSLDEVDPQSMRSRKVQGLYLCGEVLDIAGPVGGYNLQSAFATGFLAGETAARDAGFGEPA